MGQVLFLDMANSMCVLLDTAFERKITSFLGLEFKKGRGLGYDYKHLNLLNILF